MPPQNRKVMVQDSQQPQQPSTTTGSGGGAGSGSGSGPSPAMMSASLPEPPPSPTISAYALFFPQDVLNKITLVEEERDQAQSKDFTLRCVDRIKKRSFFTANAAVFQTFKNGNLAAVCMHTCMHVCGCERNENVLVSASSGQNPSENIAVYICSRRIHINRNAKTKTIYVARPFCINDIW